MVTRVAHELRQSLKFEDNLFLDRYASSVTNNGEDINLNATQEPGYGVWRLTGTDFNQILNQNLTNRQTR